MYSVNEIKVGKEPWYVCMFRVTTGAGKSAVFFLFFFNWAGKA